MVTASSVALRRPNRSGFMAPFVVSEMVGAIEAVMGADNLALTLKDAQLFRLPRLGEPVREDKAARLHQSVRRLWPLQAHQICVAAGEGVALRLLETQITDRAQAMLGKMPRATGAWLLAKTAHQHAWTFSGSGEFVPESESRFVLRDNPIVAGEVADSPVCHFHAALFEKLFSTVIHPRLICREVACRATGSDACVFEFTLDPQP